MKNKKVLIIIVVAAIIISAGIVWFKSTVIFHPSGTAVRVCYDRKNISFDLELSQEEAAVVLSVLNGKRRDLDMTVTGAGCGFGRELSFIIDRSTYCLAQDTCDVIWEEGTNNYYVLSTQEMKQLKEIFKAHGAKVA